MAKEEGLSVDEVCRRLILELAAEEGDETELAQKKVRGYKNMKALKRAAKKLAAAVSVDNP